MAFIRLFINLLIIISLIVIFQAIMNFFGIEVSVYLIFLCWAIALLLFYYILPSKYEYFNN